MIIFTFRLSLKLLVQLLYIMFKKKIFIVFNKFQFFRLINESSLSKCIYTKQQASLKNKVYIELALHGFPQWGGKAGEFVPLE